MVATVTRRQLMGWAAALASTAYIPTAFAETGKTRLQIRTRRDLEVLDPAFRSGAEDATVCRAIYQNLFVYKPDQDGVPADKLEIELDAAASFEAISETEYRFTLKPGQMFTDGYGEMTAEDVKFSFERIGLPKPGGNISPYAADWAHLKGVEVDDKYSGRILLEKPRASLEYILANASGGIVCKRAIEERGVAHNIQPVGSSALRLTGFERQRQTTLARNPDFQGQPSGYDQIILRVVQDQKTVELAMRSSELDFSDADPTLADSLANVSDLTVEELPGIADVWLGMNVEHAPFDNLAVRRAVRAALDVDEMLMAGYDGKVVRANAMIMPQLLGHWKDAPVHQRDPDLARSLLAEAGMASGFSAQMLVLNQPTFVNMALVAQAQLAEVGINIELDVRDGGSFWSAGKGDEGKKLQLFIMRFNGALDPNYLAFPFASNQVGVWNWQRWTAPAFDEALEKASEAMDTTARASYIVDAQKAMEDSAAFVWLTHETLIYVRRNSVRPSLGPFGTALTYNRFAPV
ncbi:ABC transporter substrate-binding protein [Paracoccus aminophilus]|nr:ABC transporter substrate-binding protein [Paracoccus aminophilus]